ncbi:putative major facilitator transporter Str1/Tri12, major facilitator superfamily [Septoria linicola]|nr:putative major facilitator transporter Str1/Tri12, major facilitator superfamily [Septoria linicola]
MSQQLQSKLQELELAHAGERKREHIRQSEALATDASQVRQGYFTSWPLIGAIASISLSTVASYWGFSPAAAVITVINRDIGPSANASLFSIIWSVASAISIILFGRISDKFGRRWILIAATATGFVGGVVACTANTINTLVGANVMLGLAAGVHTCYGLTVGEICPHIWKFFVVAVTVVFPNVVPTGFGAYLANMLVDFGANTDGWRWIYYMYLIMQGVALILMVLFYHPPNFRQLHGDERTVMDELKRVDWIGMVLLVAGLVLFLLGVSWGGQPLPWSSSQILGLVITDGILLIIFGFWEVYSGTPNPLIPMHYFKDVRGFSMLFIISAVSGTVYLASAIISLPSRCDLRNIDHGLSVAFLGALISCNPENFTQSAAFSFLATFPAGILEVASGLLVQLDSNDADLGTCFSIIFLARTAVGAIFTAIFVAILSNTAPTELAKTVPPAAIGAGLPETST